MADQGVESIINGGNDQAGSAICEIFVRNPPDYAVYRTHTRVLIQFSDKEDVEKRQRATLAPIGPLRSEVNGLIDGWRVSTDHRKLAKARLFDRRTADALVMALEGDVTGATVELNAVRNNIIDGRKSIARFLYLIIAFVVAVIVVGAMTAVLAILRGRLATGVDEVLIAIGGGAAGAFFSIATGLSKRTILTDLQQRDNAIDAVLRMVIGVISAGILICLLRSGFVPAGSAGGPVNSAGGPITSDWMRLLSIGFLAGFSERMVPDLLEKAGNAVQTSDLATQSVATGGAPSTTGKSVTAGTGSTGSGTGDGGSSAGTPTPTPPPPPAPPPSPDDDSDCLSDEPLAEADATPDHALPAADGGVAPTGGQ